MVLVEDIRNGIAVRCDPSTVIEPPEISQDCLEEVRVGARRDPVYRVVATHHRRNFRISDAALERRKVVFAKVLEGHLSIKREANVAIPVFEVVSRIMFAVCDDFKIRFRVDTSL